MTVTHKLPRVVSPLPDNNTSPAYDVRELTHKSGQARLILDDAAYTLRITRAGKLGMSRRMLKL